MSQLSRGLRKQYFKLVMVQVITVNWGCFEPSILNELAHILENKQFNYKEKVFDENDSSDDRYLNFDVQERLLYRVI